MNYKGQNNPNRGQRLNPGVLELWLYVIIVKFWLCTLLLLKYIYWADWDIKSVTPWKLHIYYIGPPTPANSNVLNTTTRTELNFQTKRKRKWFHDLYLYSQTKYFFCHNFSLSLSIYLSFAFSVLKNILYFLFTFFCFIAAYKVFLAELLRVNGRMSCEEDSCNEVSTFSWSGFCHKVSQFGTKIKLLTK